MVPHLITAQNGPISELEQRILDSAPAIERWLRLEWMEHTPPFYAAVDIRNAGFKLAPVGTNLFPRGWRHLTPDMRPLAVQAAQAAIEKNCPDAHKLLIVPANGAQADPSYLQSLVTMCDVFTTAGLQVRLGSIDPAIRQPTEVSAPGGQKLLLEPAQRIKGKLGLKHFLPCVVVLNNDLTGGTPGILEELHQQYLMPPLHAGWGVRRKSRHVAQYDDLAKRFGKLIGIDPWLINPLHDVALGLDLTSNEGLERVRAQVDALLTRVRRKCKEYSITDKPFVVVKVDNGPGGRGVKAIRDAAEVPTEEGRSLARSIMAEYHARGIQVAAQWDLLLQEGVPTHETIDGAPAEPVVYTLDRYVIGGVYRQRPGAAPDDNLNMADAAYAPLAFAPGTARQPDAAPGASAPNRFYMYGVIARLAALAASYEIEATDPEAQELD